MSGPLVDLGVVRVVAERSDLLQTFRAAHALCEAGAVLAVTVDESRRFDWLSKWFNGLRYERNDTAPELAIRVDHLAPRVVVGCVERPLLFAHAIFEQYRARWANDRPVRFSFAGLGTPTRRNSLCNWADANSLRMQSALRRGSRELEVKFTRVGRKWPEKGWDQKYVDALARTQFALCPNGDSVWTYRFFEAAAAGAIPIVEEYCDLYDGFAFHTFDDGARNLEWGTAAAEHNAALVRRRLTAPHDELASAIRAGLGPRLRAIPGRAEMQ
jgi:hypothetical protein